MRLIALAVALAFILSACITDDNDASPEVPTVEQTSPAETEPSPTTAADPTPNSEPTAASESTQPTEASPTGGAGSDDAEIQATIDEIAEQTAQVRGLELLNPIDSEIIGRDQLAENLVETLDEDYGREGAELDRDLLWMLRLIDDRDLDYYQLQLDLYTEQVAGYYESETKELYVIGDDATLPPDQKVTMSHEITHALQDQHFGLDRYNDESTDIDAITAFAALTEGDATNEMVQWAGQYLTQQELMEFIQGSSDPPESPAFDNSPPYVQQSLLFPYDAGFGFVQALIAAGGLDAVNAAFENPPISTEQIMHPEKFISDPQDVPLEVDMPDLAPALGDGWSETYQGTLGEFDLNILLDQNGADDSKTASAGWGGTRFAMYANDADLLTILATRWDTEQDATEFQEALTQTMSDYDESGEFWTDGTRFYSVVASGDSVTLTSSTNQDALTAAQPVNTP